MTQNGNDEGKGNVPITRRRFGAQIIAGLTAAVGTAGIFLQPNPDEEKARGGSWRVQVNAPRGSGPWTVAAAPTA